MQHISCKVTAVWLLNHCVKWCYVRWGKTFLILNFVKCSPWRNIYCSASYVFFRTKEGLQIFPFLYYSWRYEVTKEPSWALYAGKYGSGKTCISHILHSAVARNKPYYKMFSRKFPSFSKQLYLLHITCEGSFDPLPRVLIIGFILLKDCPFLSILPVFLVVIYVCSYII